MSSPERFQRNAPESHLDEALRGSLKEYASQFVDGKIMDGKEIVHEGDKSKIYQCFEENINLPGIENAAFRLHYRKYHEASENRFDQLRFEYTLPNDESDQVPFAEMHLGVANESTFVLEHRYVKPEYRDRRGVGTSLLNITEAFVQETSNKSDHEATILLRTGQEDVINWLEKKGYAVSEEDKEVLDELRQNPENFVKDQVIISDDSAEAGIVKTPYTFRKETEGRYIEDAIRLTFEKKFNPVTN